MTYPTAILGRKHLSGILHSLVHRKASASPIVAGEEVAAVVEIWIRLPSDRRIVKGRFPEPSLKEVDLARTGSTPDVRIQQSGSHISLHYNESTGRGLLVIARTSSCASRPRCLRKSPWSNQARGRVLPG